MSSSYTFLPWLRQGLSGRLTGTPAGNRGLVTLSATLTSVGAQTVTENLALPQVELFGPGDVTGLDPRQVVRTDPVAGATEVELDRYPSVDLDSPVLPWLFTPEAVAADRLRPWLCLVAVRQQDGVRVTVDRARQLTVLEIAAPADARAELPNLADAWAFAHVQVSGAIGQNETLAGVIADQPERAVSRLICPTPLRPASRYYACVVPTYAAGRAAGLGQTVPAGLAAAWQPTDQAVALPVYHLWEFATGDGGDFAALAGALRFAPTPPGTGRRTLTLAGSGITVPTGALPELTFAGPLCAVDTTVDPAPSWVRQALAPIVGAPAGVGAPLYCGEQTGAHTVAATDSGWLAELNLDPRHRSAAALGAYVVEQQQEALVSAAWTQAGQIREANALIGGGQVALAVGASVHDRHLATLPAGTLAQVAAPLQATASADVAGTTAFRRATRMRGPLARRAVADQPPPVSAADAAALLAAIDPATTVASRLDERVTVPGGGPTPTAPVSVAPSFPTPMFGALCAVAPQFVLPGAGDLPVNGVVLLKTNPRFVAAFLAGLNTAIVSELRWRGFPVDPKATPFRYFWDWRGGSAAAPVPDVGEIPQWPAGSGLHQLVGGASAAAQVVLAVRGELLRRFPRTSVYAVRAASATTLADENVAGNAAYPLFGGAIDPDIRFFGFPLSVAQAVGGGTAGPGYFFLFQQQVTETRFGPPTGGGPPQAGTGTTAADVAVRTLRPPMRIAVHGSLLLTQQGGGGPA